MALQPSSKSSLVLIGGGHSHLQVLHYLGRQNLRNISLTLISDVHRAPYSGMLPGYLLQHYQENEFHFDLREVCSRYGFQFLHDSVEKIIPDEKLIVTKSDLGIPFDFCSVNAGINPLPLHTGALPESVLYVKPISAFLEKWKSHIRKLTPESRVIIIGGGGAGFELAIACSVSLGSHQVTLITGPRGLMPEQRPVTRKLAHQALSDHKVHILEGESVHTLINRKLHLQSGKEIGFDLCLVSTTAAPPPLLMNSSLPLNKHGFLCVDDFLQVYEHENIFASGDCIHFSSSPLPKAGVFAVRQGPVLAQNLLKRLRGEKKLKRYTPQKSFLSIFVSGRNEAILSWKLFSFRSSLAWKLKNLIDLRFMKRFR